MPSRSRFFIVVLLFVSQYTLAQTDNAVINEFIERYIENTEDEVDIQQFADQLLRYYNDPIDLNEISVIELYQTPFFTGNQARAIAEHRKEFGDFISIYELQVVDGFTAAYISEILPFVVIESPGIGSINIKDVWKDGTHQFMTLAETITPKNRGTKIRDTASTDFDGSYYLGSSLYSNLRYRFDYRSHISAGINMEKDAGEEFLGSNQPLGFDYYSFYFSMQNIGKIKNLQLGDFQANFGQGLTLSSGLAFGKSSIITNSKRNMRGFGAYRSLRENAYLRGGAVTFRLKNIDIGTYVSYKKTDGNGFINDSIDSEKPIYFTSVQEDGGLHRTLNEIGNKHTLGDLQFGAHTTYNFNAGRIGTIHTFRKFSQPLELNTSLYNQFNFSGDAYSKHGLFYDVAIRNVNLYGEYSYSSNKKSATLLGALVSLGSKVDLSLVYRNYESGFINLQSSGFGETSNTSNENGWFAGFGYAITPTIRLLGYYDIFKSNWLKSSTSAPSSGHDFWIEAIYKPNKAVEVYYRYRTESKQINISGGNQKTLISNTIERHRFHAKYALNKAVSLRTRVEWNTYKEGSTTTKGSLAYQDIIYKPFGSKWNISYRIASSSIEDFDNRIYAFEQVALYDYPLHTHSYSGIRTYLLIRYVPTRNFNIWARYGLSNYSSPITSFEDNSTIGSGLQEIEGNVRNTFTIQLRYIIK